MVRSSVHDVARSHTHCLHRCYYFPTHALTNTASIQGGSACRVGLLLTQIIKQPGENVIPTASTEENAELVRKASADQVSLHGEGAGKGTVNASPAPLKLLGTMAILGGASPPASCRRSASNASTRRVVSTRAGPSRCGSSGRRRSWRSAHPCSSTASNTAG